MADTNKSIGIIDSDHPDAVLRAWIGAWDMGAWPNSDEEAFERAVRAKASACFGVAESEVEAILVEEIPNAGECPCCGAKLNQLEVSGMMCHHCGTQV